MREWKQGWMMAVVALMLFWTGATATRAQHHPDGKVAHHYYPSTTGHGTFPIGHEHHVGQFEFSVSRSHSGVQGYFQFAELDANHHTVAHIFLHPVQHLSIEGHTARFDGTILWDGRHARVEVTAVDNGEHGDAISIRVTAHNAHGDVETLYEVGGIVGSGGIQVHNLLRKQ